MKVRLIIKQTFQPPIDTPASIGWQTLDIEHQELFEMLRGRGTAQDQKQRVQEYMRYEVVGAEALPPDFPGEGGQT